MDRQPCVYILASQRRGTLYIGVTANLARRLFEHRNGATQGFTERYGVHHLVHVDQCATMPLAIAREKQLKNWHRDWKINLIEAGNPNWDDLAVAWNLAPPLPPSSC